jgi:5-methylcytosine-specific restriction endonuclease McrA
LTLDHVTPRYRGGEHSWENVVSCCISCNCHKAGHTPSEAGMQLLHKPLPPHPGTFYVPYQYRREHDEWRKFIS